MENNITYDETDTIVCGEAQEYFNSLDAEITESQFKLRQDSLRLLMGRFGQENPAKSIYECAHEWSCKYSTTSGLVNYYNTYYNGRHDNT
jgi:hypothetical protein